MWFQSLCPYLLWISSVDPQHTRKDIYYLTSGSFKGWHSFPLFNTGTTEHCQLFLDMHSIFVPFYLTKPEILLGYLMTTINCRGPKREAEAVCPAAALIPNPNVECCTSQGLDILLLMHQFLTHCRTSPKIPLPPALWDNCVAFWDALSDGAANWIILLLAWCCNWACALGRTTHTREEQGVKLNKTTAQWRQS